MKKLFLIGLLGFSISGFAQQGSWYIGGNVGFSSSKYDPISGSESSSSTTNLAPEFGTFLKDDLQLGLALGIGMNGEKVSGKQTTSATMINPTIYGRKFFNVSENFNLYGGLKLSLISEKSTDFNGSAPDVITKSSGMGFGIPIGAAFALSPKFTMVGEYGLIGFTSKSSTVGDNKIGTDTNFDFGVNTLGTPFTVGLYYTFKE